jgi:hypothetical protein
VANEEDPKTAAKKELATPEAQRLLRQFVNTDGPKGTTNEYRAAWIRVFGKTCSKCCEKYDPRESLAIGDVLLCPTCAQEPANDNQPG